MWKRFPARNLEMACGVESGIIATSQEPAAEGQVLKRSTNAAKAEFGSSNTYQRTMCGPCRDTSLDSGGLASVGKALHQVASYLQATKVSVLHLPRLNE